ncbi:hypothetical protein DPMN_111486 [Dreissena polymorpha]|uniref:Tudor domain-containing protein n=1 Tax=Dreissena polymorpha TaxID=45954 RepID=A0A9D4QPY8_DREPO|nr:hypothetical protein DPMN_111486 [Dreissena polymorpha]
MIEKVKTTDNSPKLLTDALHTTEKQSNGLDLTEQVASSAGKMKGKKKKKRNKNKKQIQWKQGDLCRAKYTEDGCVYDAEIISIDDACGTCTVRYLNYENEEEQDLKNLQQPKRRSLAAKSLEQSEAEVQLS